MPAGCKIFSEVGNPHALSIPMSINNKKTNLTVLPFLVALLTMARINDDTLATREVHAAVVTTYLTSRTQQPKLHRQSHTHSLHWLHRRRLYVTGTTAHLASFNQ